MSTIRLHQRAPFILAMSALCLASHAAFAAPPTKVGVTYTKAGGATTVNSAYTPIVELSLPAGKYLVTGRGTVQNQQALTDTVSCNVYAGTTAQAVDANTTTVPSGEYGALAFSGVAILATSGTLWVECIATVQGTGPFTSARLTATTAADVISLP